MSLETCWLTHGSVIRGSALCDGDGGGGQVTQAEAEVVQPETEIDFVEGWLQR